MSKPAKKSMRDVLIEGIYQHMFQDERLYFLSADFGSPALDQVRKRFPDRFQSVGIAEQNLINVSTGLALEGFTVFAYGIAPFVTMRAYEQLRTNLALHAYFKALNVNIIGVGTGMSYDVSGPTHHCLEDISLIRLLPNIDLFSPSDWVLTRRFLEYCLEHKRPKYLRLDSKPVCAIYNAGVDRDFRKGFCELVAGEKICIVSTGYMTHIALNAAKSLSEKGINIGVIDLFLLKSFDAEAFYALLHKFSYVITLEEAFILRGGMDAAIADILIHHTDREIQLIRLGIRDKYVFELGGREYLHKLCGIDAESIIQCIEQLPGVGIT